MRALKLGQMIAAGIVACALGAGLASAKLPQPPMDEAAKAKAEEAKAKTADAAKKAREQEEKAMDRVAERYKREKSVKTAGADPRKK